MALNYLHAKQQTQGTRVLPLSIDHSSKSRNALSKRFGVYEILTVLICELGVKSFAIAEGIEGMITIG